MFDMKWLLINLILNNTYDINNMKHDKKSLWTYSFQSISYDQGKPTADFKNKLQILVQYHNVIHTRFSNCRIKNINKESLCWIRDLR